MSPAATPSATIDLRNVSSEAVITFPGGLVGQPDWNRFVLLTPEDDTTVAILQSVDHPQLALMVTNPCQFMPAYEVELSDGDRAQLGLSRGKQPVLLTTLSVHGQTITANLLGPLVINPDTRCAKQLVLADSVYSSSHPVAELMPQDK